MRGVKLLAVFALVLFAGFTLTSGALSGPMTVSAEEAAALYGGATCEYTTTVDDNTFCDETSTPKCGPFKTKSCIGNSHKFKTGKTGTPCSDKCKSSYPDPTDLEKCGSN